MVAGFVGGVCVGLFATIESCAAFGISNLGEAIEGNGKQVYIQIYGGALRHRLEYRGDISHFIVH
jgi:Amt family ammonium transporter